MGLLESALYRPRTGYYEDLSTMSAALFESLLRNHPFVDGNKRAAFFVTDIFLRLNGFQLKVEPSSAHRFIIGMLEEGDADMHVLRTWIREHMARCPR